MVKVMYRSLISLFFVTLLLFGCKSYTIPYEQSLANTKINTGLYVPGLPPVYIHFEGLLKYPIHGGAVEKAFKEANLKKIIFEEFKRHGRTFSNRACVVINDSIDKNHQLTRVENADGLEPKDCEFVFTDVPGRAGNDYIMVIKVTRFGFNEGGYNNYATLSYIASINDMKNNRKIWQHSGTKETSFPLLQIAYTPAKDPEKVRENLRDCVNGMIREIANDINK